IDAAITRLNDLGAEPQSDGRRETRVPSAGSAMLQMLSPLSFEKVEVRVADASENGFGILTPVFLEPGTIVYVQNGDSGAAGAVRYCEKQGDGTFKAGVQVQPDWIVKPRR